MELQRTFSAGVLQTTNASLRLPQVGKSLKKKEENMGEKTQNAKNMWRPTLSSLLS